MGAVVMESAMQLHSYRAQSGGEGNVSFHVTKKRFENLKEANEPAQCEMDMKISIC
jgi:hypothetical protein